MKVINIIAPNIKSGGGKELLEYLLEYIDENYVDIKVNVYVDISSNIENNQKRNVIVMTSKLSKIMLFFKLFENVIYFGNLPPIRKSKNSLIYFHNTHLLMSLRKIFSTNSEFINKIMYLIKQIYIKIFVKNVDFIVCQTEVVSKQIKKNSYMKTLKFYHFTKSAKESM